MQSLTALSVSAQMRVPRSVGDSMNVHSVLQKLSPKYGLPCSWKARFDDYLRFSEALHP